MLFPTSIHPRAFQTIRLKALSWTLGIFFFCTSLSATAAIALQASEGIAAPAPAQLTSGIEQAEIASEQVYEGLETTKALIGKRESRNKAIAHGRDRASQKLENLAQKAKRTPEALNDSEQHALEQLAIQR